MHTILQPPRPRVPFLRTLWVAVLCLGGAVLAAHGASASPLPDDPPSAQPEPETRPDDPEAQPQDPENGLPDDTMLAVIRGYGVNVRAGPRIDNHAVTQLSEGTLLVVVDRVPGWLGVRVPVGVPAVVALQYVERLGPDAVRVTARRLNLRAAVPEEGKPLPGALAEPAPQGTVLALLEELEGWAWVLAPEDAKVFVHEDYVSEVGPLKEHRALLEQAQAQRIKNVQALALVRKEAEALRSGEALRERIGETQQLLWRLRQERGFEQAPVVDAANALEATLSAASQAPISVRRLAAALCRDLEFELEIRTARKDAEVARLRGLKPPEQAETLPSTAPVTLRGVIRWEASPRWRNGGAWVLWQGELPVHVLELTVGLPPPIPDPAAHADGLEHEVTGVQNGEKVFGLPVLVLRAIK